MKELIAKLIEIEKTTSLQKGKYDLFALFLREAAVDKWDILVAAPWIDTNKAEALKYLAENIQSKLSAKELASISHIAIIDEPNPALAAFQQAIDMEHGAIEIKDSNLFGLDIKQAFLLASRNKQAA